MLVKEWSLFLVRGAVKLHQKLAIERAIIFSGVGGQRKGKLLFTDMYIEWAKYVFIDLQAPDLGP